MENVVQMRDYSPRTDASRIPLPQEERAVLGFKDMCPHCRRLFVADRVCTAHMDRPCEPWKR